MNTVKIKLFNTDLILPLTMADGVSYYSVDAILEHLGFGTAAISKLIKKWKDITNNESIVVRKCGDANMYLNSKDLISVCKSHSVDLGMMIRSELDKLNSSDITLYNGVDTIIVKERTVKGVKHYVGSDLLDSFGYTGPRAARMIATIKKFNKDIVDFEMLTKPQALKVYMIITTPDNRDKIKKATALSTIEQLLGIKLIRGYKTKCYYTIDGYCRETNTAYDVIKRSSYKSEFKTEEIKDRADSIIDELGCTIVTIEI